MWALTQAGPWTSTLNDTPLRVSSIIWYRLGFCFQTLFDFGIFWQPIIYFLRWKKQIKKWMIYQTKYLYPPALAHNHISIYHFHKIWGFRGENLLETLLNYKSKRNTLTKGYETNPSTGHADALHMRGNLIIPLYLKSKNQFPLTYYIATSYDICLMLIWMTRE